MSSAAVIPFFLRAWKIVLDQQPPDGEQLTLSNSNWGDEAARITFEIDCYAGPAYWTANLSIYNLSPATQNQLITSGIPVGQLWQLNQPVRFGDQLSISAGYRYNFDPQANLLFKGTVFQPMWTRKDVVDSVVTLRCMVGLMEDANNFVSFTSGPNATQAAIVAQIAKNASIPVESVDSHTLGKTQFLRPQVVHGRPGPLLRQIAKDNNLQMWISPNGLNIRSLDPGENPVPDVIYGVRTDSNSANLQTRSGAQQGVKPTIIGVPEQTEEGVVFRVLMDSQPKIGNIIQLAPGTAINQLPIQYGQYPPLLDKNGMYIVAGIRHVGDSRGEGDDWYTELTCLTFNFWPFWKAARGIASNG